VCSLTAFSLVVNISFIGQEASSRVILHRDSWTYLSTQRCWFTFPPNRHRHYQYAAPQYGSACLRCLNRGDHLPSTLARQCPQQLLQFSSSASRITIWYLAPMGAASRSFSSVGAHAIWGKLTPEYFVVPDRPSYRGEGRTMLQLVGQVWQQWRSATLSPLLLSRSHWEKRFSWRRSPAPVADLPHKCRFPRLHLGTVSG
jgi:hypothetical protein